MASGLEQEFATLHEIVKAAKIRLNPNIWDYLIGATETESAALTQARWWTLEDVENTGEPIFPRDLAEVMRRLG